MNSDATILSLLTISKNNTEEIIFLYLRELEELAPGNLNWYVNKGKNGKCEYLWEEKKIKQWLVIGQDDEINELAIKIFKTKNETIKIDDVEIKFLIKAEKIFQINEENDIEKIDGINKCTQLIKYKFENFQSDISFLIGSKDNCSAIEGYKNNEVIKSISPPAFLSQDFFYVNIQVFQLAFFERRNIYSYMRADRNTHKGKEPTNYYGFIQSKKEFREKIQLEIMNFDGNSSLGTTKIDSETGQWQMKLSQPLSKGQFLTKDLNGLEHVCGKKFYLIMDFHIDLKVVNRTLKDLYGRSKSVV